MEKELDCSYQAEPTKGIFKEIVSSQLLACKKNPAHYMWYTFWFLIRKSDRTVVGSASFKDIPDEKGEVEIGYSLGKNFEHNGYMTEVVTTKFDEKCWYTNKSVSYNVEYIPKYCVKSKIFIIKFDIIRKKLLEAKMSKGQWKQ